MDSNDYVTKEFVDNVVYNSIPIARLIDKLKKIYGF